MLGLVGGELKSGWLGMGGLMGVWFGCLVQVLVWIGLIGFFFCCVGVLFCNGWLFMGLFAF